MESLGWIVGLLFVAGVAYFVYTSRKKKHKFPERPPREDGPKFK